MRRATAVLVVCVLCLLAFGLVMLYSVSPVHDSTRYLSRQLLAVLIGLTGGAILARIDYRHLRAVAWPMLVAAVGLLALVLILGTKVNGARRWFRLAGVQFQPSDLAKLALLVVLAHYGANAQRLMLSFRRGILLPALTIGAVIGLIFLEPDWGTALLLAVVSGVMLMVAGARLPYLLLPVAVVLAGVGVLLAFNPVRTDRVYSWLHLEETKDGIGYQAWQARLALGAGGLTGKGLTNSSQKNFVPEQHTDFIFSAIGEECGFVGSMVVVTTFLALFLSGSFIAAHAVDGFGRLLGTGISFLIGLQALINLGVVSGALPNKGLALPFISYGGSNLIIMLFCAGILVSIAREAAEQAQNPVGRMVEPNLPFLQIV